MPARFVNVSYHAEDVMDRGLEGLERRTDPLASPGDLAAAEGLTGRDFDSDEAAARFYLSRILGQSDYESTRSLVAPDQPAIVPDLRLSGREEQPLVNTRVLTFEQTHSSIPVFGSKVFVELDPDRRLVSSDIDIAEVADVSSIATLSPRQALAQIAEFTGVELNSLEDTKPPELTFFATDDWHLAYFYRRVPAAPPGFLEGVLAEDYDGHGLDESVRLAFLEINYLVDAHDGAILFYYSANALLDIPDIPTACRGEDEDGVVADFWGRQASAGFELSDPVRNLKTYDLGLQKFEITPLPGSAVTNDVADWGTTNRAAISAHVNATRVYDFYNTELKRDGIDGKGMELVSVVNCVSRYPRYGTPPEMFNAFWSGDRMIYGQRRDSTGQLRSFARYLDVIAHELTHGVTQCTSKLVYQDQSGALNESFSDIFGILVKNWSSVGFDGDVNLWNWELGSGLGRNGLPLRDMRDPTRTGDPDHMKNFLVTKLDSGGVHTNSNIHNKAAYNVLTAVDGNGNRIFSPREVAVLYYLTLTRLGELADFAKTLQILTLVAKTYYAGNRIVMDRKVKAIVDAYAAVGIAWGLRSQNFRTRAAAVKALADLGDTFLQDIIDRLADDYPQVRVAAIASLERLRPDGAWRTHLKFECYVPAGEFIMGDDNGGRDEKPAHRVYLDAFYIARYPVTNAEYARFMADRGRGFDMPAGKEKHPVTNVTWFDAKDYTEWADMRLLTEAEWEKAASWEEVDAKADRQGNKGRKRKYPWEGEFDAKKCNTYESGIYDTTPVGQYSPAGDSPCGAADMAGNVWEWCSSKYEKYPYKADDGRENLTGHAARVLRGGSFAYQASNARCAARLINLPHYRDWYIGLRLGWQPPSPLDSGNSGL